MSTHLWVPSAPGGAFPFLPMPGGDLQELHVPLEAVWDARTSEVCELLFEARSPAGKCQVVESALLAAGHGFIELFRDEVGVTPKAFARLCRFQHVLGAVEDRASRNHIAVHD